VSLFQGRQTAHTYKVQYISQNTTVYYILLSGIPNAKCLGYQNAL